MKKRRKTIFTIILIFLALLIFSINIYVDSKKDVVFKYVLDGDSAVFLIEGKETEVRMIGIDTPEKGEKYAVEAKEFTRANLEEARTIELLKDPASSEYDKYGRSLFWVFVDGKLLEEELVLRGYAKVDYLTSDYLYTSRLFKAQDDAKAKLIGIYSIVE